MHKLLILFGLFALSATKPADLDKDAVILAQESEVNYDGSYKYRYETSNGIFGQESGVGGEAATGAASWVAPDGTQIQLSYTADINGYVPSGSHLPTPPPTPEAILRALEYIARNPPPPEGRN